MAEEQFGSGLALTSDWDLDIDSTGDIKGFTGSNELEKDIAVLLAIRLRRMMGDVIPSRNDTNARKQVELVARRTIQTDSRVTSVESVDVNIPTHSEDEVQIEAEVIADNDRYELHFEV